jgi:uncharacterized protein YgiB involved in biofilm formation
MSPPESQPVFHQSHPIYRQQVKQYLAIAAVLALLSSSCKSNKPDPLKPQSGGKGEEKIEALYYKSVADCKADTAQQAQDYQTLKAAYDAGKLTIQPKAPVLKPEDCDAQFKAAQQEHDRTAPVYANQADCQADGVRCEPTPSYYSTRGYRPMFGGAYFNPYSNPVYIYSGGVQRQVYQPSTVYQGTAPNQVVTPLGRTVTQPTTGRVTAPKSVTAPAPARPAGTAAKGTISGRSSTRGFGSSFKGTGRGGK